MLLNESFTGQILRVKKIVSEPVLRRRLFELGFLQNACIQVLDISPFRYAFLLRINESVFAIRQQIANKIVVENILETIDQSKK